MELVAEIWNFDTQGGGQYLMQVLIVDNHDSFTYNLVQLFREFSGVNVIVVRNDELLPADWSRKIDAAVISPGPGHPGVSGDVGVSRAVIEADIVPILGVCLGHQLIALMNGCTVDRSSHPQHGELSRIEHNGDPLFHQIPKTFDAVRYHSLDVQSVQHPVQSIAQSSDGTLMALRVADRPMWGIQFHPESIESDFGHALIGNFLDLAESYMRSEDEGHRRFLRHRQRSQLLSRGATVEQVLEACTVAPCVVLDGIGVSADGSHATVLGWNDQWSHQLTYHCGGPTEIVGADRAITKIDGSILEFLDSQLDRASGQFTRVGDDPGISLGYVGYLGYEVGYELLDMAQPNLRTMEDAPDAWWTLISRAVVIDNIGRCFLVGLDDPRSPASVEALDIWMGRVSQQIENCCSTAAQDPVHRSPEPQGDHDARFRVNEDEYLRLIESCQNSIRQGDSYELCLTNQLSGKWCGDPLQLYVELRAGGRIPHAAYIHLGNGKAVVSGSPELFLAVDPTGHVISKPIKGTRRACGNMEMDKAAQLDLSASLKDRAENLMIVDLVRNDFNREALPGTTVVTELYGTYIYPTVVQMISTVECDLRPGANVIDMIRAAFPPGSMTGAPKERSVEILAGLEQRRRGIYSGSIGLIGLDGTATLNVAIRTLELSSGSFTIGVGGAITRLSDPDDEWQETLDKSRSTLRALRAVGSGATTQFTGYSSQPAKQEFSR